MYKRNNESFLKRVFKEAENNPNQIIVKDKWHSWTWSDIIKTSYRFSEAIRNNYPLSQKPVAIPLLVGRSGKVISRNSWVVLLPKMHLHHYQLSTHRIE